MTVPEEAIDTAAEALMRKNCGDDEPGPAGAFYRAKARIALEAAVPLIAAAERERRPRLSEDERWLVEQAREQARRWLDSHPDGYLSTERALADYVDSLVKILDDLLAGDQP